MRRVHFAVAQLLLSIEIYNKSCELTYAVVFKCSVFAFAGPAPEVINGRLAMLAFVAAAGAEFATGFTAVQQLSEAPVLVGLTFAVFIAASLVRCNPCLYAM